MLAIETVNLCKKYNKTVAVSNLNLKIEEGEIFTLLGLNGAGKTTSIKMLCCLALPTSGDALVGGYSIVHQENKVKSIIGVSPQETAIAPNLSVFENLELMCMIHGFDRVKCKKRINDISDVFCLDEVLRKKAGLLSGGWQRKVSIAMAMICEPKILFLDEPTLGLDIISRNELWKLIKSLRGRVTVILTTHYMEEACALSDRIGIMNKGELIALGTANELMKITDTHSFDDAFISIVGGVDK